MPEWRQACKMIGLSVTLLASFGHRTHGPSHKLEAGTKNLCSASQVVWVLDLAVDIIVEMGFAKRRTLHQLEYAFGNDLSCTVLAQLVEILPEGCIRSKHDQCGKGGCNHSGLQDDEKLFGR